MPKRGNTEGSIYFQTSKQRWVAAITQEDGRRKWIYAPTGEQVAAKLPAALVQVQRGIPFTPETLTVGKHLGNWVVGVRPSVRPKTYRSYEQLVRVHITPALGKIRLVKLQKTDIERFLAQHEQAGSSPRTRQYLLAVLRMALKSAVEEQLVFRNVASLVILGQDCCKSGGVAPAVRPTDRVSECDTRIPLPLKIMRRQWPDSRF